MTDKNEAPPAYTSPLTSTPFSTTTSLPSSSSAPGPAPAFRTSFAALALSMTDKLRFINFPRADISFLQASVAKAWPRGIQRSGPYGGSYEIKLSGRPWEWRHSNSGIVEARVFMGRLLAAMWERGWVLRGAVDVSVKQRDKDSLLFRHQSPPPPPHDFATLTFHHGDLLLLSSFPRISQPPSSSSSTTPTTLPPLHKALIQTLGPRIQSHDPHDKETYVIKFHGYPWRAQSEETVAARVLLIKLLEVLEGQGWSLYGSISLDAGQGDHGRGCDSWVVVRRVGWRVGELVFQS